MLVVEKAEPHRAVTQSLLRNKVTHFQFSETAFLYIKHIEMCLTVLHISSMIHVFLIMLLLPPEVFVACFNQTND